MGQIADLKYYYWPYLTTHDKKILEQNIEGLGEEVCVRWGFIWSKHLWTRSILRDLVLRYLLIRHRKKSKNLKSVRKYD